MARFARVLGAVFVALLVLDTVTLTALVAVRPSPWGWAPMFFPILLGFVGLVVFGWAMRLLPTSEREADMPPVTRTVFRASVAVLAISQVAAVVIALGCLAFFTYMLATGTTVP